MKKPNKKQFTSVLLTLLLIVMMTMPALGAEVIQPIVSLGTTSNFAILAGSTITSTGPTTINGDVGLHPGTDFVRGAGIVVNGAEHITDPVAAQAKDDLVAAYIALNGLAGYSNIPVELGQETILPGYYENGTFAINGTLTLDAQNNPNAIFVFKAGTTLMTGANSNVNLVNGAQFAQIFWVVGTSATLGVDSHLEGSILALDSITATTRATVDGQLFARNGAVTLDSNTITMPGTVRVIKEVINDEGGTKAASDFLIYVKTSSGIEIAVAPGAVTPGNIYRLPAGDYQVSEGNHTGYTVSYSGDSDSTGNFTLTSGENKTVTITNNDTLGIVTPTPIEPTPIEPTPRPRPRPTPTPAPQAELATLHVIKHIINNDGRTAVAADFRLHVKIDGNDVAASPAPGAEAPGTTYALAAGTYQVSEDAFAGYSITYSGDGDANGNITLAPGDNKTITITNNDTSGIVNTPTPVEPTPIKPTPIEPTPIKPIPTPTPIKPTPTPVPSTIDGGQLPKTSSYMYEFMIGGVALVLIGTLVWSNRKRFEKS